MAWKGNTNNPAPNDIQENSNVSNVIKGDTVASRSNRAENIRRDLDTNKDFTVKLIDIDTAISDYVDKIIDIHVLDNSNNIKVPLIYANPEKWKAIQKDGFLRDGQGKIQLPIMSFSRKSVAKRQELMSPNRHLTYPVIQKFSEKNKYDPRSPLHKIFAPVHQIYSVSLPDHVTIVYDFLCQAEYVEQMNTIIQKINWAAEDYWGDPKRFRFMATVGDYSLTTETPTDNDRMVKATFTLTVNAYLLEESMESRKLTTEKILTKRKIVIGTEIAMSADELADNARSPFPYSYVHGVIKKDSDVLITPIADVIDTQVDGDV